MHHFNVLKSNDYREIDKVREMKAEMRYELLEKIYRRHSRDFDFDKLFLTSVCSHFISSPILFQATSLINLLLPIGVWFQFHLSNVIASITSMIEVLLRMIAFGTLSNIQGNDRINAHFETRIFQINLCVCQSFNSID